MMHGSMNIKIKYELKQRNMYC